MRLLAGVPLLLLGGLIAAWLSGGNDSLLRAQLTRWQFWALETQCMFLAALSWANLPRLVRTLRLSRATLAAAAAASLLAVLLATTVAPRTNRVYYDEHIYQGIGQNLADLHLAQMCNDGAVEYGSLQCRRAEYYKEPYGYPYLLSLGYRLFGVHEGLAHGMNVLCAFALVWVVFALGCALFEQASAGVWAACVIALTPQQILWSHTAAAEPSAALMSALAVLTAVHYVRERSTLSLLWMIAAAAFAVGFRPESVLVLPLLGTVGVVCARGELARERFWLALALGLLLCSVAIGHMVAVGGDRWGATGPSFAAQYLWPNLKVNGMFYLKNVHFPALYTCLAVMGLVVRPTRAGLLAAVWFFLFWGVFLFFYAGSYEYGTDVRYSLVSYAPLAVLAGRGASCLLEALEGLGLARRRIVPALALALLVQFLWFMPEVRAFGEEAWEARADVAFAQQVSRELPKNSVVLTHNPSIFHLNGVDAAQMSLGAADAGYVVRELAGGHAGGVFLHWNAWCNYDDVQQRKFCDDVLRAYESVLYREHRERSFRYAFYRLKTEGIVLRLKTEDASPAKTP